MASTKRIKIAKGTEEKDIELPPDLMSQISMSVLSQPAEDDPNQPQGPDQNALQNP